MCYRNVKIPSNRDFFPEFLKTKQYILNHNLNVFLCIPIILVVVLFIVSKENSLEMFFSFGMFIKTHDY